MLIGCRTVKITRIWISESFGFACPAFLFSSLEADFLCFASKFSSVADSSSRLEYLHGTPWTLLHLASIITRNRSSFLVVSPRATSPCFAFPLLKLTLPRSALLSLLWTTKTFSIYHGNKPSRFSKPQTLKKRNEERQEIATIPSRDRSGTSLLGSSETSFFLRRHLACEKKKESIELQEREDEVRTSSSLRRSHLLEDRVQSFERGEESRVAFQVISRLFSPLPNFQASCSPSHNGSCIR